MRGEGMDTQSSMDLVAWPIVFRGKDVRTMIDSRDKSMWFHAADTGEVLAYANIHDAIATTHVKTRQLRISDSIGRSRDTTFISEQGLYKLAFRSNKPEAEEFTDRVAQVLTDLRAGKLFLHPVSQPALAHLDPAQQKANSKTMNRLAYSAGGREEIMRLNISLCKRLSDNGWPPKGYTEWAKASGWPSKQRGSGQEVLRKAEPHSACVCSLAKNLLAMGMPEAEVYDVAEGQKDFYKRVLPYATPAELHQSAEQ
jgi:prophage antirepressor-like protein